MESCSSTTKNTISSHGLARSCDELKNISPLPECQWPPNLLEWWLNMKGFYSKSYRTLWSYEITWQTKTIISKLSQCVWLPRLTGWWLTLRSSYPKSHMIFDHMFLQDHLTNKNHYISTKFGKMVVYHKGLIPIKLDGLFKSPDKLETFCRYYHNAYSHQIWQVVDLWWGFPTDKVTFITWSRKITWKIVPMATKLGRMVTYVEQLSPINFLNPLVMWSCNITWQTKTNMYPPPQYQWLPHLADWWLTWGAPFNIITWLFTHVILQAHMTN